jgi:hypothetical protein
MTFSSRLDFVVPFFLVIWIAVITLGKLIRGGKITVKLPPYSLPYILFLIIFFASFRWTGDKWMSLHYFKLFSAGYFFWFCSYNFKELAKFEKLIIPVGLFYGILTVFNIVFGDTSNVSSLSLFLYAVPPLHHHHIGDLWAAVLVVLGFKIFSNNKHVPQIRLVIYILLIIFGFYLLFISLSRSAYVSLIGGSVFSLLKLRDNSNYLKALRPKTKLFPAIFYLYIFISVIFFLYAGTQKNTLIAHGGYVIQGTGSFLKNPFGIGVGNFKSTAREINFGPVQFDGSSNSAHNIILEMVSGLGVLSIPFLFWLYSVLKSTLGYTSTTKVIISASIFICIFVNFFFDYTYLIPLMLWGWFFILGLFQAQNRISKLSS